MERFFSHEKHFGACVNNFERSYSHTPNVHRGALSLRAMAAHPVALFVLSIELAFAARRIHTHYCCITRVQVFVFCPQLDFGLACRQLGTADMALRRVFIDAALAGGPVDETAECLGWPDRD